MGKVQKHREELENSMDWKSYILDNSNLPGKRANLELLKAAVEIGKEGDFLEYINYPYENNTPEELLVMCGVVGLGKIMKEFNRDYTDSLRKFASSESWRIREGVAMALQVYGEKNEDHLIDKIKSWAQGTFLEQRALIAGLCEPDLLKRKEIANEVLSILDEVTKNIVNISDRKDEDFKTLRKALAYCWSVAVVHNFEEGKVYMEKWVESEDKDIKWIMKENLKKKRLERIDKNWVELLSMKVK